MDSIETIIAIYLLIISKFSLIYLFKNCKTTNFILKKYIKNKIFISLVKNAK